MRKWIKTRIDNNITPESSKDNEGNLFRELSCTLEYKSNEFEYIKGKIESKYGIKFNDYYRRSQTVDEWDMIQDTLLIAKKVVPKKPLKLKVIKDSDWGKVSTGESSREEALERFYRLRAEEKRQRLLEEAENVGLLLS